MSYKVIIADDEPLVLIGLEDMIDWQAEGFEVVGQARNGGQLSQEIERHSPDLVITDIKMPVKTGIEVLEEERKKGKTLPLFIFLTSFEEFDLIKKALSLEAVDYIVKLELEKDQLVDALRRAAKKISERKGSDADTRSVNGQQMLQERYFMRQLFALDTHDINPGDVGINMDFPCFAVAYITLPGILSEKDKEKSMSLFYSASRLLRETINRYTLCYVIPLDLGHCAAIFPFSEKTRNGYRSYIYSAFRASTEGLRDFFSLDASVSIGPLVNHSSLLSDSFSKAKLLSAKEEKGEEKIVFFDHSQNQNLRIENIDLDSRQLTKAFSELNAQLLDETNEKLISSIRQTNATRVHAIDAASSVLYMALNSVPDLSSLLEEIFPSSENIFSYRMLYQAGSSEDVILWLRRLCSGLKRIFAERKQDYRLQTVQRVQAYIMENITGNLDLGSVASIFGYSKNYLSSLFTRYTSTSFIDYVNTAKMERAKKMLADPNAMVYEVATALGYDSPFYFSKVFKKVVGMSPTAYQNTVNRRRSDNA